MFVTVTVCRQLTAAIFVLLLAVPILALGKSCGCEVSDEKEQGYDRLLWLNERDRAISQKTHLPWGVPVNPKTATNEHLLVHREFVINYDDDLLVPTWTAHRLRKGDLKKRARLECFRQDERLENRAAAFCTDYDEPIYDRGHMVPNGDMTRSESAMINTYMFSNMTPQHCAFNRGIWQILEVLVRHWATSRGEIYVITGSVFDRNGDEARDADDAALRMKSRNKKERVAVPSHLYKILVHQNENGAVETLSVMLQNLPKKIPVKDSRQYLEDHITSIAHIEKTTGLSFFEKAAAENPNAIAVTKNTKAAGLWPVTRAWPGSLDSTCKE
jgi:DNA/RNA endonuclease G (NUC1)